MQGKRCKNGDGVRLRDPKGQRPVLTHVKLNHAALAQDLQEVEEGEALQKRHLDPLAPLRQHVDRGATHCQDGDLSDKWVTSKGWWW